MFELLVFINTDSILLPSEHTPLEDRSEAEAGAASDTFHFQEEHLAFFSAARKNNAKVYVHFINGSENQVTPALLKTGLFTIRQTNFFDLISYTDESKWPEWLEQNYLFSSYEKFSTTNGHKIINFSILIEILRTGIEGAGSVKNHNILLIDHYIEHLNVASRLGFKTLSPRYYRLGTPSLFPIEYTFKLNQLTRRINEKNWDLSILDLPENFELKM